MHESFRHLNVLTVHSLVDSEEKCISLFQDLGLIPRREDSPPDCPNCGKNMVAHSTPRYVLNFRYVCTMRKSRENRCSKVLNPLENTFFEGVRISFRDVLVLLVYFVRKDRVTHVLKEINEWRRLNNQKTMGKQTVADFFSFFKEVAEIWASNSRVLLGGKDKVVELDETFLTKRKYKKGIFFWM